MGMDLVVVRPFGTYRAGDRITDAGAIDKVLGSENRAHVVRAQPLAGRAGTAKPTAAAGKGD